MSRFGGGKEEHMFGTDKKKELSVQGKTVYQKIKNSYIIVAVAYVVFGMSLLIRPELSGNVICYSVGAVCLIYSIATLIRYFIGDKKRHYVEPNFILPVLMLVFGLVIIFKPSVILSILPIAVGIVMVVSGIMKLQDSFQLKKYAFSKWWSVLIFAIISLALGIVIILNPFGTGLLFIRMVGLFFATDGVFSIVSGILLGINNKSY